MAQAEPEPQQPPSAGGWTAERRAAVVLMILKGTTTPQELALKHGLDVAEINQWQACFVDAGRDALTQTRPWVRRGPDMLVRSVRWFATLAWLTMVGSILLIDRAKPSTYSLPHQRSGSPVASHWDSSLLRFSAAVMVSTLALCIGGLLINTRRYRRKDDRISMSLVLLGVTSLLGLGILWFFFV